MKDNSTIPGSTDATGLFTARLTYATNKIYPPLFCYNENNELVKGVVGLEVKGPVWQYNKNDGSPNGKWTSITEELKNYSDIPTRQVYIIKQPILTAKDILEKYSSKDDVPHWVTKKHALSAMQEYAALYSSKTTPIPEAQPLEGVKTAEEINKSFELEATQMLLELSNNEFAAKHIPLEDEKFKDGYINGYIVGRKKSISENAQFATDAGEGKAEVIAKAKREYETGKIGFVQALEQVYQAKAPSTHSSSEMVEANQTIN